MARTRERYIPTLPVGKKQKVQKDGSAGAVDSAGSATLYSAEMSSSDDCECPQCQEAQFELVRQAQFTREQSQRLNSRIQQERELKERALEEVQQERVKKERTMEEADKFLACKICFDNGTLEQRTSCKDLHMDMFVTGCGHGLFCGTCIRAIQANTNQCPI